MKQQKYYAVRNGRIPGIYRTWDECKARVDGYSGAEYKSFTTEAEALEFMGVAPKKEVSDCEVIAYTDGSYNIYDKRFAYGIVMFARGEKLTFSEAFTNPALASMRNVAGEIMGARRAMEYCIENGYTSLEILYDYEGVEKWCTGVWKTTKEGTAEYCRYYNSIKEKLRVVFTKVKGHSGNKFNDEADRLAKDALGIE